MPLYTIRDIDTAVWKRATRKAKQEGHTMRWLFLRWLTAYVMGTLDCNVLPSSEGDNS